jgi:hypothetical protein
MSWVLTKRRRRKRRSTTAHAYNFHVNHKFKCRLLSKNYNVVLIIYNISAREETEIFVSRITTIAANSKVEAVSTVTGLE